MVYSGRNGFTNPRLLCPYIRLTDAEEDGEDEKGRNDASASSRGRRIYPGRGVLASESEVLRRSLKFVGCRKYRGGWVATR